MKKDWIPGREQDLAELCGKWVDALGDSARITAFGWEQAECAAALAKLTAFLAARELYARVNSTGYCIAKNEAKGEAVDSMREFANTSIRFNKKMRDEDRMTLGIHPSDTTPTAHGPPASQPDTEVENTHNHFEHLIRAINHDRGDHSKPEDAYGVRYAWQVGGERPPTGADLPKTKFSRKTTFILLHSEAEKRKTVFYAACYENAKGQCGPWSPISEAIVG